MRLADDPIRRSAKTGRLGLVLAFLALAPMPLTADWLLLRDGTQLEIAGSWRAGDGLVTFELARRSGLFSLRAEEVDLAGSEALTRQRREEARRAEAPVVAERPQRREPVLVLTDRDVRKVRRDPTPPVEEEPDEASGPPAAGEAPLLEPRSLAPGIEVATWQQTRDPATGAMVIEGELENRGSGLAVGLELRVTLTAGDGAVVAESPALLSSTTLAPRQRSRFRVEFADPGEFEDVDFQMSPLEIAEVRILWPFGGAVERVLTI